MFSMSLSNLQVDLNEVHKEKEKEVPGLALQINESPLLVNKNRFVAAHKKTRSLDDSIALYHFKSRNWNPKSALGQWHIKCDSLLKQKRKEIASVNGRIGRKYNDLLRMEKVRDALAESGIYSIPPSSLQENSLPAQVNHVSSSSAISATGSSASRTTENASPEVERILRITGNSACMSGTKKVRFWGR